MKLTPRQKKFVAAYDGNAAQAARAAGYSTRTAKAQGSRLLTNADVAAAIKARQDQRAAVTIATREQRQAFWTQVMNDKGEEMTSRLKASELLGKSEADFIERHKHEGTLTLEQMVVGSMEPAEGEK